MKAASMTRGVQFSPLRNRLRHGYCYHSRCLIVNICAITRSGAHLCVNGLLALGAKIATSGMNYSLKYLAELCDLRIEQSRDRRLFRNRPHVCLPI